MNNNVKAITGLSVVVTILLAMLFIGLYLNNSDDTVNITEPADTAVQVEAPVDAMEKDSENTAEEADVEEEGPIEATVEVITDNVDTTVEIEN